MMFFVAFKRQFTCENWIRWPDTYHRHLHENVCVQLKLLNLYIKRAVAQKNSESSDDSSSKASSPVSVIDNTSS